MERQDDTSEAVQGIQDSGGGDVVLESALEAACQEEVMAKETFNLSVEIYLSRW